MTDYWVGGLGTDDGSHGTGSGALAWLSLEYALEDGGLTTDDTLYVEHVAGVPTCDYWKTGTNNRIIPAVGAGSGQLMVVGVNDVTITLAIPADTVAYLISPTSTMSFGDLKITNPNNVITISAIALYATVDVEFGNLEIDMADANNTYGIRCLTGGGEKTVTLGGDTNIHNCKGGIKNDDVDHIVDINITSTAKIHDCAENAILSVNGMAFDISHLSAYNCDLSLFNLSGTGYTYAIDNSLLVKQNEETEEYIVKLADATALEIYDGTTDFSGIVNNIFWHTGTPQTDWNTLIYSATHKLLPIPISNRFVEPDGSAIAGWTWPVDEGKTPVLDENTVAFFGDSIMHGRDATTGNELFAEYAALTGLTTVDEDVSALPGLDVSGGRFFVDYLFTQAATKPKYVYVAIGINSIGATGVTNANIASGVQQIIEKIIAYGSTPIWLGVLPLGTGANTNPKAINSSMQTYCNANSISWGDLLSKMELNETWATDYYEDISTNIHPNDAGHLLMATYAYELLAPTKGHIYISADATAEEGYGTITDPAAADSVHLVSIQPGNVLHVSGEIGTLDLSGITIAPENPSYTVKPYGVSVSIGNVTHYGTGGRIPLNRRGGGNFLYSPFQI